MRQGTVRRFALVALLATVTSVLGCGEGALDRGVGPATRSLTGTWEGPLSDLTMRLVLTETNGNVAGTGTMIQAGQSFTLSVTGSVASGTYTLQVSEPTHATLTLTGSVQVAGTATTMTGVANGAGFTDEPVTLTKQ